MLSKGKNNVAEIDLPASSRKDFFTNLKMGRGEYDAFEIVLNESTIISKLIRPVLS